jgi:hypothetical protein
VLGATVGFCHARPYECQAKIGSTLGFAKRIGLSIFKNAEDHLLQSNPIIIASLQF